MSSKQCVSVAGEHGVVLPGVMSNVVLDKQLWCLCNVTEKLFLSRLI